MAVAAKFGWSWALPAYLYLAAVAIAFAAIDLDVMRLPDKKAVKSVRCSTRLPISRTERSTFTIYQNIQSN